VCDVPHSDQNMVAIEIDIEDSLLFRLMKEAHEADITLNKYMQSLIEDYLDRLGSEGPKS
jgi:hypothetical protein